MNELGLGVSDPESAPVNHAGAAVRVRVHVVCSVSLPSGIVLFLTHSSDMFLHKGGGAF